MKASPNPLSSRRLGHALSSCLLVIGMVVCQQIAASETTGLSPVMIEKLSTARQLVMLRALCDGASVTMHNDTPACTRCPSYTGAAGKDGRFRISNAITGTFTRPNASQILLDMAGCEDDTNGAGGAAVLEQTEKGWQRVLYVPGLRPRECIRFRTLFKVQSLACNVVQTRAGVQLGELTWVELRDGQYRTTTLLHWLDNMRSDPRRLVSLFPQSFMKADFNQDGRVDLRVVMKVRDEAVPEKYSGAIGAINEGYRFAEPASHRLIYLFDGKGLTLQPGSEAAKAGIDGLFEKHRP
jgi:hypothetical protein